MRFFENLIFLNPKSCVIINFYYAVAQGLLNDYTGKPFFGADIKVAIKYLFK